MLKRGILFSYIPWKVSLSGEVGGYPQALLKVVNLQGMLELSEILILVRMYREKEKDSKRESKK